MGQVSGQGSVFSLVSRPRLIAALVVAAVVVAAFVGLITTRYTRDARASLPPTVAGVPVSVGLVKPQSVHPFAEFSGRIDAVDYAEIRPQVTGRITEIRFKDGQEVEAGDILFVIDPRPYQAAVAKAQADLQTAINNAKFAKTERDRGSQLIKNSTLAQETYDQRANADDVAQAAVKSAQALLATGAGRCRPRLCQSADLRPHQPRRNHGRQSGRLADHGAALLASIVSDDGVYADFEVDEQTYLEAVRNHGQTQDQEQKIPVDVDGAGRRAVNLSAAPSKASTTTSIPVPARSAPARASPMRTAALMPGMFVSVRMGSGMLDNALAGAGKRDRQRPEQALCLRRRRAATRRNTAQSAGRRRWMATRRDLRPASRRARDRGRLAEAGARRASVAPQADAADRTATDRKHRAAPRERSAMNLSKFFIDRPIFAGVISVVIFLAGLIAMTQLPISEYPEVVPPSVVVTAQFPGANPETIAETVATPLEEQINGVENMLYMFSQAATRRHADADRHLQARHRSRPRQQLVQNRVNQALPRLPRGHAQSRRHHDQELARPHHGGAPALARRPLRHALSAQLCGAERQGPARQDRGRRQRAAFGSRRLRHAHLAQSGEDRRARPDRRRRGQRHPRAECAGRGRRHQRPALWHRRAELQLPINVEGRLSDRRNSATSSSRTRRTAW